MDPSMLANLAALPPHLKLQIMAAAQAQAQAAQPSAANPPAAASDGASSSHTTDTATEIDPSIATLLAGPVPPPPFTLPVGFDLASRCLRRVHAPNGSASGGDCAREEGSAGGILCPAMVRALAMHGFFVMDGFTRSGGGGGGAQGGGEGDASAALAAATDEPSSSDLLTNALREARRMHADRQMTHAGMKSAETTATTTTAAAAASGSTLDSSVAPSVGGTSSTSSSSSTWRSASLRGDHHRWLHHRSKNSDSAAPTAASAAAHDEEQRASPALHRLLDRVDRIRGELNQILSEDAACSPSPSSPTPSSSSSSSTGWHPSTSLECQVACYLGGGSRYVAHRDSILGQKPVRRVTAIVYMTPWTPAADQGGCLRVYLNRKNDDRPDQEEERREKKDSSAAEEQRQPQLKSERAEEVDASAAADDRKAFVLPYFRAGSTEVQSPPLGVSVFLPPSASQPQSVSPALPPAYVDLAPLADRLVVFSSHQMLHEVRPSHGLERFAMTVWMQ